MLGQPYTTHHLQFHHILFYHSSIFHFICFSYKHPLCFYLLSPFTHGYCSFHTIQYMICYIYVAMVTIQNLRVGGEKGWLTDGIHTSSTFLYNATYIQKWPRFSKLKLYDDIPYSIPCYIMRSYIQFLYTFCDMVASPSGLKKNQTREYILE